MKQKHSHILIAAGLILIASVTRIVNAEMHLYNFAPLAALGLFCGAVIKDKRYAFLFPVAGMLLGDLYFHFFTGTQGFYGVAQLFTYVGLVAVTILGMLMKNTKALNIFGFTVGGSMIFFLVSNFGYYAQGWNGYSFSGLTKSYIDAIPFYRNSMIGDLIGSMILFGLYFMLQRVLSSKMQKAGI
jgi:hypothetical protein